jgi:hypothetical protein
MTDEGIDLAQTGIDASNIELMKIVLEGEIAQKELDGLNKHLEAGLRIEMDRVKEYYDLGYGHIVSPEKSIPMSASTRNAHQKFLNAPTYQEIQLQNQMKRTDQIRGALVQLGTFILAIGVLVVMV